MERRKEILVDAAKVMLKSKKSEDEIVRSFTDIGLSRGVALALVEEAKQGTAGKPGKAEEPEGESGREFWETGGGQYFPGKEKVERKDPGIISRIFGRKKKGKEEESKLKEKVEERPPVPRREFKKTQFREILPVRVGDFDKLIERGGIKRGDTIMVSGGCGVGKTTFGMQSLYNGALKGEKGIYLTLEESVDKMKENMLDNFGWNLDEMERKKRMAIVKIDPLTIARAVEATLTRERGGLYIEFEKFDLPFQFDLPFKPDRVVFDSLSALSIAFMENEQAYRMYLRHLFSTLEKYNSVNFVLGETEQEPGVYSRSGIEEFLADGVVVFYNVRIHNIRERAIEILKLRSSNHEKRIVPYKIGSNGIEIYINEELFREK